jgi:membrane protease YdiL (CAAX protease family)
MLANILSGSNFWLTFTRVAIILLTLILAVVTYQSNQLLKRFRPDFNLLLSGPENLIRIGLVGICLLLAWTSGLSREQLGLVVVNPWRQIGLGLVIGLFMQMGLNGVMILGIKKFGRCVYSPVVISNILPRRPIEWILVPLAFIPAVLMEELLFRPLWIGVFSPIMWLPVLVVGTSFVFGVMHLPQGILGAILAGGANILLSLSFVLTGSFLTPLLAHYTMNLLQIVLAHFQRDWLEKY